MLREALMLVALLGLVGCADGARTATGQGATPTSPSQEAAVVVPTQQEGDPVEEAIILGTLMGDEEVDGGCLWLQAQSGERIAVLWPPGYKAHFNPVELIDPDGAVVAVGGDLIEAGGGSHAETMERCQLGLDRVARISEPKVVEGDAP